ncbi:MAG: MBL fold metallo-hydrolase [Prochlorotrichaceae cyanobacterium]
MKFTYFGSNSWLVELSGYRILIDPWFVGDLCFGGQEWLFRGKLTTPLPIPAQIDLILLSQGLADHAHEPTLRHLDQSIPVVGSAAAAKVAQRLGFLQVTALSPSQIYTLGTPEQGITLQAVPGAPVPQVENGYVVTNVQTQERIYYEPHGFFDRSVAQFAPVEVLISPVVDLALPFLGSLIQGYTATPELVQMLQPKRLLPTATGGEVEFSGLLLSFLKTQGSLESFQQRLRDQGSETIVTSLAIGESFGLSP